MTDPNGAAIYGMPWIPSRNIPVMLALIYQHQPDPMGYKIWGKSHAKIIEREMGDLMIFISLYGRFQREIPYTWRP